MTQDVESPKSCFSAFLLKVMEIAFSRVDAMRAYEEFLAQAAKVWLIAYLVVSYSNA